MTTFAFVSVKYIETQNSKLLNRDYGESENEEQKKKFEYRILKKIEERLGVSHVAE